MSDYTSVQNLIVKAAIYDGVSTTIMPTELLGYGNVLKIIFQKGDNYSATHIDITSPIIKHEAATLQACKHALKELLWYPYKDIEVVDGEANDTN